MPLGILTENDFGEIKFEYFENILTSQYLTGLEKNINISSKLFPVFENLLPENAQLDLLKSKYSITSAVGALLYLEDIHGTFEFSEYMKTQNPELGNNIFKYTQVKKDLLDNSYIFPNILHNYVLEIPEKLLYPSGLCGSKIIGLSGYQYKFGVHIDNEGKRIYQLTDKDSAYIMKPNNFFYSKFAPKDKGSVYIPFLLINEHIFMTIARDFGFDVPYNAIIKHGEYYHFIIKRFDRYNNLKIDHTEILSLLNRNPEDKYNVSCKDVIELCSKYLNHKDMTQIFRFIVFSVIIAHGDLHAKNISLICKSNDPSETEKEIAPFYDISTSAIYYGVEKNDIGMQIKNKKKEITLEDLLWISELCNIDQQRAREIIKDLSLKFIKEFQSTYIEKLPNDIKNLPFYEKKSIYSTRKSLIEVFNKYYKLRCEYIRQYLQVSYTDGISLWE